MRRVDVGVGLRAWEAVNAVHTLGAGDFKKYRSRAIEMSGMLTQSGLVQTLSFLASRRDTTQRRVAADLVAELARHLPDMPADGEELAPSVKFLLESDDSTRAAATRQARLFADWLRRALEIRRLDDEARRQ